MNIAELFVRIRGDTTDLHRKLTDAERAMLGLERSSKRLDGTMRATSLQTGRLSSQFAGLAGSIAGVHPIVGNLAGVLGNFAVGGAVTAGVLLGVAAIAVAWDKLTDSTRKAKEEQDKLIESLEKAIHLKGLGPGGATVDEVKAAKDKAAALLTQIKAMEALIVKDALDADVITSNLVIQQKINELMIERQNMLNVKAGGEDIVQEKVNEAIKAAADEAKRKAKELAAAMKKAAEEAGRYAQYMYEASKWTANISGATLAGLTLLDAQKMLGLNDKGQFETPEVSASMPNVSMPFEGLDKKQKEQLNKLGILTDDANRNAETIRDAIWGSATQMANSIVGALNIGGGGKGSNLGGALGGTAGFALGFMAGGAIGGAIGSTIGNIAGSLFGGLFDSHKKEVNANTQALRQNTAALLLNTPSGYKVAAGRFDATDVKALRHDLQRYATRGGAPILVTP